MSKERFEWIYNEKVLKHYIFDNLEHKQLAYKDIIYLLNKQCQQIDQLKQQLEEKDKEIERLKNLFKLNNEVVMNQGNEIFDLRVQVLQQKQNQTQLAIQELEKVKDWLNEPFDEDGCFKIGGDLIDFIDQQIKELRRE